MDSFSVQHMSANSCDASVDTICRICRIIRNCRIDIVSIRLAIVDRPNVGGVNV